MSIRPRLLHPLAGSSGQTTVEFALVVPLLCLFAVLVVEFGTALVCWFDATRLASMGARVAAVNTGWPDGTSLEDWIRSRASTSEMRHAGVCISLTGGDAVEVTVARDFQIMPISWMHFDGVTLPLKGTATMRLEQPPPYAFDTGCTA